MYRERLSELSSRMRKYDRELQSGASEENLRALVSESIQRFHAAPPAEYLEFLRVTDGLDWNGLQIYGTETREFGSGGGQLSGFVEVNIQRRDFEPAAELFIFGDGGVEAYGYHIPTAQFQVLDRVTLEEIETVGSFDALIIQALDDHW